MYQYKSAHKIIQSKKNIGNLWLGDINSANDQSFIYQENIKLSYPSLSVMTVAFGLNIKKYPQVKQVLYPLNDSINENISRYFQKGYIQIQKGILKIIGRKNGSVLVHCASGISRVYFINQSATIVIAYIMKKLKTNFKQAISLVRQKRQVIRPNLGFQKQLKLFEILLQNPIITITTNLYYQNPIIFPLLNYDNKNQMMKKKKNQSDIYYRKSKNYESLENRNKNRQLKQSNTNTSQLNNYSQQQLYRIGQMKYGFQNPIKTQAIYKSKIFKSLFYYK